MSLDDSTLVKLVEPRPRTFVAAHVLFARYVLFALIAGFSNLAAQKLTVRLAPTWPVMVSVQVLT
jgi:hypothetical protein